MHCLYFICERKFYARTHVKLRDIGNQPLVRGNNGNMIAVVEESENFFSCWKKIAKNSKKRGRDWNSGWLPVNNFVENFSEFLSSIARF